MIATRRAFLGGLAAVLAAPAVIHFANAMPIHGRKVVFVSGITTDRVFLDVDIVLRPGATMERCQFERCNVSMTQCNSITDSRFISGTTQYFPNCAVLPNRGRIVGVSNTPYWLGQDTLAKLASGKSLAT